MANLEETKKIIAELEKMSNEKLKKMLELMQSDFNAFNSLLDVMETAGLTFTNQIDEKEAKTNFDEFLIGLTVSKVKKALPKHEITESDKEALSYIGKEWALIRGTDKEKAQAKQARKERALVFYQSLSIDEQKTLVKKIAKKKGKQKTNDRINNFVEVCKTNEVSEFCMPVDRLFRALCGEVKNKNGNPISLASENAEDLRLFKLWEEDGRKVSIAVGVNFDQEFLQKNGITLSGKRHLSSCAKTMYGTVLSFGQSGNEFVTYGAMGKLLFGVKDGAHLTDAQREFIYNGCKELATTRFTYDPSFEKFEYDKKDTISLADKRKDFSLKKYEGYLYPLEFMTVLVNGSLTDAIRIIGSPGLSLLQNELHENAKNKGNFARFPAELLDTPGRIDSDLVIIRNYLLTRVEGMKNKKNNLCSDKMLFKNILSEVEMNLDETTTKSKTQQKQIKSILNKTERVLDDLKEKKYIKGYEELTKEGKPKKRTTPIIETKIKIIL